MAVSNLSLRIDMIIRDMGLIEQIGRTNSANYRGQEQYKQGDAAWVPYTRLAKADWPTVVIECAVSQSKRNLDEACRWWLSESNGKVRNVIGVKVSRKKRKIYMEVWKWGQVNHRYYLRGHPEEEEEEGPVVDYGFQIPNEGSGDHELILAFKNVMDRDPVNDDDNEGGGAGPDEAGGGRRQAPMRLGGEAGERTAGEEGEAGERPAGEEGEEGEEESEEATQLGDRKSTRLNSSHLE